MEISFIQSCDSQKYTRMVKHTMPTIIEYCEKWNCNFDFFLGIKKGNKPWHAALNRVFVLKDLVNEKYDGWVIHVDADAFIFDMEFDARSYLAERAKYCLIAAPSGIQPQRWWDINNGVFAINLGSEGGVEIVNRWFERIDIVNGDRLKAEGKWGDVVDDQNQLHLALVHSAHLEPLVLHDADHLNGGARFIRQVMRADGDLDQRIEMIAHMLSHRHGADPATTERDAVYADVVRSIYRVLLGREADPGGYRASMDNLISGRRRVEDELRACVDSPEFRANIERLSKAAIDP